MKSWSSAPLGDLLQKRTEWIALDPDTDYKQATVRLWGKGVALRGVVKGAEIAATSQLRIRQGDFIMSRIDARHGAFGLVPQEMEGAVVSQDFPVFDVCEDRLLPGFLNWMSKTPFFIDLCKSASEGTTNRVRLKEDRFFSKVVPLPPLPEQRRILAQLDGAAALIAEREAACREIEREQDALLSAAFRKIVADARRARMGDVAPLVRRSVEINPKQSYTEMGIRSFYKGAFHRRTLSGAEFTWQKLFWVREGDLIFSNLMAWEEAIAVAKKEDDGCVGNHRMLTCEARRDISAPDFLYYFFRTKEGFDQVVQASPGSIARNKTLSSVLLKDILVPLPSLDAQQWFVDLQRKAQALLAAQAEASTEMGHLIPSLLDHVFNGKAWGEAATLEKVRAKA